ncbi:hypothetical protein LXL04_034348 [Taraxacum kok-saghyz]
MSFSKVCLDILITQRFLSMSRIAELTYACAGKKLEVRILRRWTARFRHNEMWFLAVDKYGDSIQVLNLNAAHGFPDSKFQLTRCYSIEDYTCTEIDRYQKILTNPINVNVGRVSKIREIEDTKEIPNYWFSFAAMEHLQTLIDSDREYPDVIGYFRTCDKLLKRPDEPFVKMELLHERIIYGNLLPVTLWKECVTIPENFPPSITTPIPVNTVVAVTNIKVGTYSAGFSLNSTSATHVIINPICPTASALQESFFPFTHTFYTIESGIIPDPLSAMPAISIAELKSMPYSALLGKTVLVRALLTFYEIGASWYSVFCSVCKKPIPRRGDDWFCLSDGRDLKPRYSFYISASIEDESSTVSVLLSDDFVQKLCGYSCEKILSRSSTINKAFYTATGLALSVTEHENAVSVHPLSSAPASDTPGSSSSITNVSQSPKEASKAKRPLFNDPDTKTDVNPPKKARPAK